MRAHYFKKAPKCHSDLENPNSAFVRGDKKILIYDLEYMCSIPIFQKKNFRKRISRKKIISKKKNLFFQKKNFEKNFEKKIFEKTNFFFEIFFL